MNDILIYFFIAIGLSMDAFSLALAYGITEIPKKKKVILCLTVGLFHFFMPKLGALLGTKLLLNYVAKANYLVGIIFIILALEMFFSRKDKKSGTITNLLSIIIFAFTVSIDSFSIGIALSLTTKTITTASLIFAGISTIFTFLGVELGNTIAKKFESKSEYIGIIILLILGIKYLLF